jgi:hypothetical protein
MDKLNIEFGPSATGLMQCLRLLAQEAAALNLVRTLSAIEDAMDTAAYESGLDVNCDGVSEDMEQPMIH